MADQAQFEALMRALMSEKNEERKAAEAQFEGLVRTPPQAAPLMCTAMVTSADLTVRSMTTIMFRKRVDEAFYKALPPDMQAAVKAALITCVQNEKDASTRKKMADTTGEVASMIMEEDAELWPEMFPFLFASAQSPDAGLREAAHIIMSRLAYSVATKLTQDVAAVSNLCGTGMQDAQKEVRLAALSSTGSVVQALSSFEEQVSAMTGLLPTICGVLTQTLNEQDEDSSRQVLEELINIAEEAPKYFRKQIDALIQLALQVATASHLEEETRFLAVELLLTLAEQAAPMMRKQKLFLENIIPLALQLMLQVEEVDMDEWNSTTEDDNDGTELTSLDVGKDALDRLALSIGGKTVFGLAFRADLVPAFLLHQDWHYRHAALSCISQIAEGCEKQMKQKSHLETIVAQVAARFADPHPRVRWAAINAMGQLETDLGPDLQNQFHQQVLPALVTVMDDTANARVQSHAAAAVINFTENCKKEVLEPYLMGLLGKLGQLLGGGVRIVQEQAITAIASVADCVGAGFAEYYPSIMPVLKHMLQTCTAKDQRTLRGKTMECISLIGIAVGRDVFINDAKEIMDQFHATQSSALDPDDPQVSYLLQAWGRVAKALKQDFIPYLGLVMPPLMQSALLKVDTEVVEDDADADDDEGIATVVVQTDTGSKRVALKTSLLEEKATACNMLVCYFAELGEGMFSYIEQVATEMVKLLAYVYSEEVRTAAAALMPELIKAAVLSRDKGLCDANFVAALANMVFEKLISMVKEEPEPEVQLAMIEGLQEGMVNGGAGCLGQEAAVNEVLLSLRVVMSEVMDRCQKRAEARQSDEDYDEEEEEVQAEAADRDDELLDSLTGVLAALTKTHKQWVLTAFQPYVEVFGALVQSSIPSHRRIGICAFDELLENLEDLCAAYIPQLLPPLIQYSRDDNPQVRQASVYGLGICAQYGGALFAAQISEALGVVHGIVNAADARSEDNGFATDNAISALGKMILYQAEALGTNRAAAVAMLLAYLPVVTDEEEGIKVHGCLCSLIQRGEPAIFENANSTVPALFKVFGAILETDTVDEEVSGRIGSILKQLQQPPFADVSTAAFQALPAPEQAKIAAALAKAP